MIWSGSRDFDARASNGDIFDIDRLIHSLPDQKRCTFPFSPAERSF